MAGGDSSQGPCVRTQPHLLRHGHFPQLLLIPINLLLTANGGKALDIDVTIKLWSLCGQLAAERGTSQGQ